MGELHLRALFSADPVVATEIGRKLTGPDGAPRNATLTSRC